MLVTTQLNRKRPKPPSSPELPDEMMSKERKIRVRQTYMHHWYTWTHTHMHACAYLTHVILLQLNYEFMRKCVASGPVTPMGEATWENILGKLPIPHKKVTINQQPLINTLNKEVRHLYEETIRKTTGMKEDS